MSELMVRCSVSVLVTLLIATRGPAQESGCPELREATRQVASGAPEMFLAESLLHEHPINAVQVILTALAEDAPPAEARRLLRCLSRLPSRSVEKACPALIDLLGDTGLSEAVRMEILQAMGTLVPRCGGIIHDRWEDVLRGVVALLANAEMDRWAEIVFQKSRLKLFLELSGSADPPRAWVETSGLSRREYFALHLRYQRAVGEDEVSMLRSLLRSDYSRQAVNRTGLAGSEEVEEKLLIIRQRVARDVRLAAARTLVRRSNSSAAYEACGVLMSEGDQFDVRDAITAVRKSVGELPREMVPLVADGIAKCLARHQELGDGLVKEAIELAIILGKATLTKIEGGLHALVSVGQPEVSGRLLNCARAALAALEAAKKRDR